MKGQLFFNGPIISLESPHQRLESVLVVEDKIVFVGLETSARNWAKQNGVSIIEYDLEGKTLTPGFIDPHLHPLPMLFFAASANLESAKNLKEISHILKQQKARITPGEWIIGVQFEGKTLIGKERLSLKELDSILPNIPCLIYTRDGHGVILNSAALSKTNLSSSSPSPKGGHIGRYGDGSLSGCFYEKAMEIPLSQMPLPSMERLCSSADVLFNQLALNGITSIGAMVQSDEEGPGGASAKMESAFLSLIREKIPQSIYTIVIGKNLNGINALIDSNLNNEGSSTKTRSIKIFADGTFGSCTACMTEPYQDCPDSKGYMTLSPDEIYDRMESAHLAGVQICIHAIGDKGISNCVDLYEKLLIKHPKPDHRHRIEHASITDPEIIDRIAKMNIHICSQPLFIRSEKEWLSNRLGPQRSAMAYPFRNYLDAGIVLAGSSDAPIESTDVIAGIDYAVNRGGFHLEQAVTPLEALQMYTKNAALLQFEEDEKGTISVGKSADFNILSANPLDIPPKNIGSIQVVRTMIRGKFINKIEH